ncbi:MAG: sigma-54-dependent Fis family transcriptional regulator [Deltaproteobacteria bacterium]|nr:sigma-54-dependent Fis family transcriptional regulator [Deltaproteobacteria bacterium]
MSKGKILAADDREGIRSFIRNALIKKGYDVDTASDGIEAFKLLNNNSYDLLITDLKMPRMDGMELLEKSLSAYPSLPVIVLTAHGTISNAVEAIKKGAFDYLSKPLESPDELRQIVAKALLNREKKTEKTDSPFLMIASSPVMVPIISMLERVAKTDVTVLLTGKSGTGKEVAARKIHIESDRKNESFIPLNCAAISPQLMESEMFGHEKGAFTGASDRRIGRFESANGGTLFLDEVGELPLNLQAKLLRVIQERTFERVGGIDPVVVDVRIIAATNRNLEDEVKNGNFREDLFHRLSVFPILLPDLKDRRDDIYLIAINKLESIAKRYGFEKLELHKSAIEVLQNYTWPGNVRELGNSLERAAILCTPPLITKDDLSFLNQITMLDTGANTNSSSLKDIEKSAIKDALLKSDGHRKKAADILGIGLRTLYNKLKEYNLE